MKVTTGYIVPTYPIYVENDDSKQTPPYNSGVTESSVIHEGDDEYPLIIETNSDDQSEQKRYLPASALLKKIAEGNAYEVYQGGSLSKENKKDGNPDSHTNSKKNMYIRNTRLFTKSPLDKDIFYTRNTRAPEFIIKSSAKGTDQKRAYYLRNTKRSNEAPVKRAFYLRNTRVGNGYPVGKRGYYLRNTRNSINDQMEKRAFYLRNTRSSSSKEHDKRPFYLRNTRDWFMRNTRSAPVMESKEAGDADDVGIKKRGFYIRNTRNPNESKVDPERMVRLYGEVLKVLNSVVHAKPIIPSRYMEALSDDNDDNRNIDQEDTIEIGKRSAGCMLRCIDEGHLHPAQCHSLC